MRHRDFIFYLFLQIALALAILTLSMNAQASSNRYMHNKAVESGHHEFASGVEEHAHHGEEVNPGKKMEQHFKKDIGNETYRLEKRAQHEEVVHDVEKVGVHFDKDTGHKTSHEAKDHMDKDHQEEVPLPYLFYWGILILVMVIILIYFVYRHKNKESKPMIPLAIFLVLFALSIYIIEIITPAFSGRFDVEALKIVHQFHEAPELGFLRFLYKFILGIFMTFFAFLNLDRKDFNQKNMED